MRDASHSRTPRSNRTQAPLGEITASRGSSYENAFTSIGKTIDPEILAVLY
jgi:hypothetical protein